MLYIYYLAYAIIGNAALLMLLWFIGRFLPEAPPGLATKTRQSWQRTINGDYQGNDDPYRLDRLLMEAELDHPGSTLRIYFFSMQAVFARVMGTTLVSFVVTGWVLEISEIACLSIGLLVFGLGLILFPFMSWFMSKPRVVG